jgi:ABC-type sugar transport system ATPase subunit
MAAPAAANSSLVLGAREITVDYPGTRALDSVSVEVHSGDVLAVVGANGSGKTTLLSVLCGLRRPTKGSLYTARGPLDLRGTRDALAEGITIVPQEPQLAATLSCRDNVSLGGGFSELFGRRSRVTVDALLKDALPHVPPGTLAGNLKKADRAMLALVAALHRHPRLIALDEPTAVLGESASRVIVEAIERVRSGGGAVVLVSHRVKDVVQLATRVVGLVDGKVSFDSATAGLTAEEIVDRLSGTHAVSAGAIAVPLPPEPVESDADEGPVLMIRDFTTRSGVQVGSLEVVAGQIVGVAGLAGSGRSRLLRALAGLGGRHQGEFALDGRAQKSLARPRLRRGIGFVPEDRMADALFPTLSTTDNLAVTHHVANRRLLELARPRAERQMAAELVKQFLIKTPSLDALITSLSGGNQQRTVLARTLASRPRLLLADEPTQGVDRLGRADIHRLIRGYAASGGAVVLVSSEFEELLGLCDRLVVMRDGRAVANLTPGETDYRSLIGLTSGVIQGHITDEMGAAS